MSLGIMAFRLCGRTVRITRSPSSACYRYHLECQLDAEALVHHLAVQVLRR